MTTAVPLQSLRDLALMLDVELLHIGADTTPHGFVNELRWNNAYYRLAQGSVTPLDEAARDPLRASVLACAGTAVRRVRHLEDRAGGRRPVMMDVARLAGVSHQTVSRVVNDHPSVSDDTRRRVETAIIQLGYRRNTAARALVTRRTSAIGIVSVHTAQYGPAHTIFGIEEAARRAGYFVNFASLREINRSAMRGALDHLTDAAVDGIVVIAPVRSAVEAVNGQQLDVPLVMVETSDRTDDLSVVVDQVAGARMATKHLLDLGHHTVFHLRGPRDLGRGRRAGPRLDGRAGSGAGAHPAGDDRRLEPCVGLRGRPAARPGETTSPPSSRATTRCRWGSCGRCTRRVARCRVTSAWWASTTSPRRSTSMSR